MAGMMRSVPHILLCVLLCMTLAVSGTRAAAARLMMAVETATTITLVICAEGQSATITLDATGKPVAPKSHDCATCPDCTQPSAASVAAQGTASAPDLIARQAAPRFAPIFVPVRVSGPMQARAPPKGL